MDVILAEPHASGAHCVYVSVDLPVDLAGRQKWHTDRYF